MVYCRCPRRLSRKTSWLLFAVFLFVVWTCIQPSRTANSNRSARPTPVHDVAEKPRFLYRSRLRENPNHAYEARVDSALRQIEAKALSGNGNTEADETIWQIMLVDGPVERSADSIAFEVENDDWGYKLVDHSSATALIQDVFSGVPDLVWAYNIYPHDVLRADLLRYLILWYYGGYYADMDVFPVCPIKHCPALDPPRGRVDPKISLVLGIEIDEPYASSKLMHEWRWIRLYGFSQYNIYAPRRFSALLRRVIVRVLAQTKQHYHGSNHDFSLGKQDDEATILETTGPGVFTDAILDGLSETLPRSHPLVTRSVEKDQESGELGSETRVTWAPFHRLVEPLFVDASEATSDMDGLAVMPVTVWGNGQRHSRAGPSRSVDACVNHRFKGVWKPWKMGWWEYFLGSGNR